METGTVGNKWLQPDSVDGNLTGINFNLFNTDNDNDGFNQLELEYLAGNTALK